MFTGIVQAVGKILASNPSGEGARISLDAGELARDVAKGDSIAISGVCLSPV